jgi:hypothetical protein
MAMTAKARDRPPMKRRKTAKVVSSIIGVTTFYAAPSRFAPALLLECQALEVVGRRLEVIQIGIRGLGE